MVTNWSGMWKKIKCITPSEGERVLIYNKFTKEINIGIWYNDENAFWEGQVGGGGRHLSATHWMTLRSMSEDI